MMKQDRRGKGKRKEQKKKVGGERVHKGIERSIPRSSCLRLQYTQVLRTQTLEDHHPARSIGYSTRPCDHVGCLLTFYYPLYA